MNPKTNFARITSFLLIVALMLGIMPFTMGAAADKPGDLPYRVSETEAKGAGGTLMSSGERAIKKVDLSQIDLSAVPGLPTQGVSADSLVSSSISFDGSFIEEELTYVEEYAEMLTEPVGLVDIDGAGKETRFVFVWLQDLPKALEDVYHSHGKHNRGYERAREDGRRARGNIRSRRGVDIIYEYSVVFSGFALEATISELETIAAMDGVFAITEVTYEHMDLNEYIPDPNYSTVGNAGAREVMEIADLHADGIDGRNIKVGVIDSGIDATHPDLAGALRGGYNFAPPGFRNPGGHSPDLSTPDGNHGTHVSGTIASQGLMSLGVAPGVDLYMAQVFSPDNPNSASSADVTAALEAFSGGDPGFMYENCGLPKVDIVNMSLGNNANTAYEAGHVARNNAVIAGVMVVNSAGNNAYPTNNTTDRRNYTLGSGGVSLPISVAASQYGGNPILSYTPVFRNDAGATGTVNFFCENGDSSYSGVFRDGSFGSLETRYVTYGPMMPPDTVYTHPLQTYTIEPLVYITGKGYELYYACANNVPTPGGTTESDMTAAEMDVLNKLTAGSLTGKILVVNRGQAFFEYKCQALRLGAAGLIVINRDENVIGNLNIGAETSAKDMLIFSAPASFKKTLYDLVQGGRTAYLEPGLLSKVGHALQPADFSSIGPVNETAEIKPDVIAPGWSILSTNLGGGYVEMSGTSMSSPWVAGVAALVKQQYPNATPAEIKARIMNTADPYLIKPLSGRLNGAPGHYFDEDGTGISVFEQGSGFVNPKRAVYDNVFIQVTNNDIPTGTSDEATFDDAKMASFSFGPLAPGSEDEPTISKRLTATVNGGTVSSIEVVYNHNTRYSNKNLDEAVEVFYEIAQDGGSFDVWLGINSWAGIDQTNGNLYEGYIIATSGGKDFVLPWATRVGLSNQHESDHWLVFFDRPVQAVYGSTIQDFRPHSSHNAICFMFGGKDIADSVELRTSYNASAELTSYYIDFYLIEWNPEGRLSHRIDFPLGRVPGDNTSLKLSDFIEIGVFYQAAWEGLGNAVNEAGQIVPQLTVVEAGAYNVGLPMGGGDVNYYGQLGTVMTNARPKLIIEGNTLTANSATEHHYANGAEEVTVNGRLYSDAIQLATDMDFYWAGYYLLVLDRLYEINQSLNILLDTGTGKELMFYNEDMGTKIPWFTDADGYFSLTMPKQDSGNFFPKDMCSSGTVVMADAYYISSPWADSGSLWYGYMLFGATKSFLWTPRTIEDEPEIMVTSATLDNNAGRLTAEFRFQDGRIPVELDLTKLSAVLTVDGEEDDVLTYAGYDAGSGIATWTFVTYKARSFTAIELVATVTYEEFRITTSASDSDVSIRLVSAAPSASVEKLSGNQNRLHIWVTESYSDGSTGTVEVYLMIANNAAGSYQVGPYVVYVDTKGNTQIRACEIVVYP